MNADTRAGIERLNAVLDEMDGVAVAVSGGVDSLTLACAAHRRLAGQAEMIHAVSPAVPPEATARTRTLAERDGWSLRVLDAGEFADERYVANPLNRCFFCKSALYGMIARTTERPVVSGTNADDLGDFRPGLEAAADYGVRHPFAEAGIDKAGVRAIAATLGLGRLADLPASPCLSSRVETGIPVDAATLAFVHATEKAVADWLAGRGAAAATVRCRVRRAGVAVEVDAASLALLSGPEAGRLRAEVARLAARRDLPVPVPFEAYRMGSAFLKDGAR